LKRQRNSGLPQALSPARQSNEMDRKSSSIDAAFMLQKAPTSFIGFM
jgi:hypothetical protein